MKRLRIVLAAGALMLLAGCFDIEEQIDIKPGGSGQISVRTDMSQLIDLMKTYLPDQDVASKMPEKPVDTTILLKDMPDSTGKIDPAARAALKDGTVRVQLNAQQKLLKTEMKVPFANMSQLQSLYGVMNGGGNYLAQAFKGLNPSGSGSLDAPAPVQDQNMPDFGNVGSIYDMTCRDGFISRKINKAKWDSLKAMPQFGQMQQASGMGIHIPYTILVNLPRPLKKIDNALAVVSADKKQVTLKFDMLDVFQHPEKFEYSIAY